MFWGCRLTSGLAFGVVLGSVLVTLQSGVYFWGVLGSSSGLFWDVLGSALACVRPSFLGSGLVCALDRSKFKSHFHKSDS